jgi:NADH-quinone oxidoreductase subunit H
LGAFRVVAQLISYEVPLAMSLLVPVMLAGSMSLVGIVEAQYGMYFVVSAPIAAFIFFISSQAETGRAPFDLLEAESELIAGFNIEYSGMKFAMFFAGEFMHVFTNGVLMAVLFMGGWIGPGAAGAPLMALIYLLVKASFWYLLSLLMRNALPRVRIDQLMAFNWKFLVPLSIANLLVMAFLLKVVQETGIAPSAEEAHEFVANIPQTAVLFLGNLALFAGAMTMVRNQVRQQRETKEAFFRERGLTRDVIEEEPISVPAAIGD